MLDLPKVYANKIDKQINNYQEVFEEGKNIRSNYSYKDIERKINEIFASSSHIYKSNCLITFKDKEVDEVIVGRTNNNLLTIDGRLIPISEIVDIKKSIS